MRSAKSGSSAVGDEAGARRVEVAVAAAALLVHVEALGDEDRELVAGAGHGDVEETALLLDLVAGAGRHVARDAAVDAVEDEHRVPLLALGRVDGGEDQVVLVEVRRAGLVAGRVRRVEGEVGEEALAGGIGLGDALELDEVGGAHRGIVMEPFEVRLVPEADTLDLGGPGRGLGKRGVERGEGRPVPGRAGRRRETGNGGATVGGFGDSIEEAAGDGRADAGDELQEPEAGDAIARVLGKAEAGEHVLDVGGVEEFQPAIFDEGDVPAGQLQLKAGAVMRGAEEHGLALQEHPGLAVLEDALDDRACLVGLVAHRNQLGQVGGEAA